MAGTIPRLPSYQNPAVSVRNTFIEAYMSETSQVASPADADEQQQPAISKAITAPAPSRFQLFEDDGGLSLEDDLEEDFPLLAANTQPNIASLKTFDYLESAPPSTNSSSYFSGPSANSQLGNSMGSRGEPSYLPTGYPMGPTLLQRQMPFDELKMRPPLQQPLPNLQKAHSSSETSAPLGSEASGEVDDSDDYDGQPSLAHVDTFNPFESCLPVSSFPVNLADADGSQQSLRLAPGEPARIQIPSAAKTTSKRLSSPSAASPSASAAPAAATAALSSMIPTSTTSTTATAATTVASSAPLERTTIMLRNLPNNYTRGSLLTLLDNEGFGGQYDFLYLPIDFKTHSAMGYAFVNMTTGEAAERAHSHFDGWTKWAVPSNKRCSVGWSDPHQGFEANVGRYRNSPLMHESVPDEYRPILFKEGQRVSFPEPTKRIKPPRQGTQRMLV
mmetsp:Transcript_75388/g.157118  ORF Transcript_75388/g.157118 Transcript_75388/m.157118 type:complete len:446 (-) Transcript_75388:61-1398(-)|eukprot:CAMPEP_0206420034 /NCGR_PEP_ID=MMETSP0324_2-20121206/559_1 /ASSEMBLY_ACC=CAM_ASM_000836 /TAXON_ID=2866 /ORGANISM="Crypthecodinium cohnii, Strain Seligo" /LENGTH=445 /DNA_ID=CAMNT_0053883755 /DNA_START=128 /DNA_END=1465 /DNA_ORIENTATION=-